MVHNKINTKYKNIEIRNTKLYLFSVPLRENIDYFFCVERDLGATEQAEIVGFSTKHFMTLCALKVHKGDTKYINLKKKNKFL